MNAKTLFDMFAAEMETEELTLEPWDSLEPGEMIAWQKLCRRLQREHGLEK